MDIPHNPMMSHDGATFKPIICFSCLTTPGDIATAQAERETWLPRDAFSPLTNLPPDDEAWERGPQAIAERARSWYRNACNRVPSTAVRQPDETAFVKCWDLYARSVRITRDEDGRILFPEIRDVTDRSRPTTGIHSATRTDGERSVANATGETGHSGQSGTEFGLELGLNTALIYASEDDISQVRYFKEDFIEPFLQYFSAYLGRSDYQPKPFLGEAIVSDLSGGSEGLFNLKNRVPTARDVTVGPAWTKVKPDEGYLCLTHIVDKALNDVALSTGFHKEMIPEAMRQLGPVPAVSSKYKYTLGEQNGNLTATFDFATFPSTQSDQRGEIGGDRLHPDHMFSPFVKALRISFAPYSGYMDPHGFAISRELSEYREAMRFTGIGIWHFRSLTDEGRSRLNDEVQYLRHEQSIRSRRVMDDVRFPPGEGEFPEERGEWVRSDNGDFQSDDDA